MNTAPNLNEVNPTQETTQETVVESKVALTAQFAQAMSSPINLKEYLLDKTISGIITTGCYIGITAIVTKVKAVRALSSNAK